MRTKHLFLAFGLLAIVFTACSGPIESGITPAPEKLTFLFFYTDN